MVKAGIQRRSALKAIAGYGAATGVGIFGKVSAAHAVDEPVSIRAPLRIGYFGDSTTKSAVYDRTLGGYIYPEPSAAVSAARAAGLTQAVVVVELGYNAAKTIDLIKGTTKINDKPIESLFNLLSVNHFDIVVLNFGVTDALALTSLGTFHENLNTLRMTASSFGAIVMIEQPNRIIRLGIPGYGDPYRLSGSGKIERLNEYVANPLNSTSYPHHYIDHHYAALSDEQVKALMSDDLHPTATHYAERGRQIGQAISRIQGLYHWRRRSIPLYL